MRLAGWVFTLFTAVAVAMPAFAAEHVLRYSPRGQLLEALPQIEGKDTIWVTIEPVPGQPDPRSAEYTLLTWCGGPQDQWDRQPFVDDNGLLLATMPADCARNSMTIRWQIESISSVDAPTQELLHAAIAAYKRIADLAAAGYASGGIAPPADVWIALRAAMGEANTIAATLNQESHTDIAARFKLVLTPVVFPEPILTQQPATTHAWAAIHQAASEAFTPYRQELKDASKTSSAANSSAGQAQSELDALNREKEALQPALAGAQSLELRQELLARNAAIDGEINALEGTIWFAQLEASKATQYPPKLLLPVSWIASGETRTGWRNRVISIDPETHHFQQNDVPLDDQDHAWLAISNATQDWEIESITEEEAMMEDPRLSGLGERDGLGAKIPSMTLRDSQPDYRISIQDLGRRRGHQIVTFNAKAQNGNTAQGSYYVRRTYHVALKAGLALNHVQDRSLEFVTGDTSEMIYDDGVPRTASPRGDLAAAPVFGLAFYLHAHDLLDDLRKPSWMRAMPHIFVGWSPTDITRAFTGIGFEPFTGFSLVAGATLGSRPTLVAPRPEEGYQWTMEPEFAMGWFVSLNTDLALFYKIFSKVYEAPVL